MNATANAAMRLVVFINEVYLPERRRINDRDTSTSLRYSCALVLKQVFRALGRTPTIADLNDETFAIVRPTLTSPTAERRFLDYFCAFWRCANANGLVATLPPDPGEKWREVQSELELRKWTPEDIAVITTEKPAAAAENLGVSIKAIYYARFTLRLHVREKKDGKVQRKRRGELSLDEGTLNHVMVKRYFVLNRRIRKGKTKVAYDKALRDFRESLGHEPVFADLNDDALIIYQGWLQDRDLEPKTINERVGRIVSLWQWMAKKRIVEDFPAITPLKEPKRTPVAWTKEQLIKLFDACRREPGTIAGIPAAKWWEAIHAVIWDSGERIGAVLEIRWEWINLESGFISVPAEVRKGESQDMVYSLHADTLALLREIDRPVRELVFPWPRDLGTLYNHYRRILNRAGLSSGRKDKFHKIRRSVASHLQAAGVDASSVLGHSSQAITRESYLDPTIVNTRKTHEVLFRPQAAVAVQPIPAPVSKSVSVADADAQAFL